MTCVFFLGHLPFVIFGMLKYISESIHEISALNKKNQRRVSCLNYCHGTDSVLDRFSVNEQVTKQAVY